VNFTARLSTAAENSLARLDRPTQERILKRLAELEANPYDLRFGKPLVHAAGRWSARVGDTWRIVYRVDRESRAVLVDVIQPRGQVYKRL
jgi:mRNA-degrading endonuclease RelE of RelBE toxin-antitoxin system